MALWRWNAEARRYYVTAEGAQRLKRKAGSYVSADALLDKRREFIAHQRDAAQRITDNMIGESIHIGQWVTQMRQEVKAAHVAQYMLAVGGKNHMTQADYGRLGAALRTQYQFLDNFASDVLNGDLTDNQIKARANLYINSSNASFERGKASQISGGNLRLPQYPGDGNTVCLTNCNCNWVIKDEGSAWHAFWRLRPGESCPDCIENSREWNPLVVSKL